MSSPIATISLRLTPSLGKKSSLAARMITVENFLLPLLRKHRRPKRRRNFSLISGRAAVSPRVAPELPSPFRTDSTIPSRVLFRVAFTKSWDRARYCSSKCFRVSWRGEIRRNSLSVRKPPSPPKAFYRENFSSWSSRGTSHFPSRQYCIGTIGLSFFSKVRAANDGGKSDRGHASAYRYRAASHCSRPLHLRVSQSGALPQMAAGNLPGNDRHGSGKFTQH